MSQDGGNGGQSARDFLALAHGQEWTNFYESFDKLVQDNLARSSELLRHAMSLPEVADREVAEIKAEMATKIAAERQTAKEAFALVHKDLISCQEQGEALQRSMTSWMTDMARLGEAVSGLVQKYDAHDDAPVAEAVETDVAEPDPEPAADSWSAPYEVEAEADVVAEMVAEADVAVEAESVAEHEAESDGDGEEISDSSDDLSWEGDVSFADVVGGESEEDESSSPQKPAWLSVARQGAAS